LVAGRELKQRGTSKAYLFTSLITIVFVLGLIIVPGLFGDSTETYKVGSVGLGNDQIIETAVVFGTAEDEPGAEPSVAIEVTKFDDRSSAEDSLSAGDVDAVLVDGTEIVVQRESGFFGTGGPTGLLQQAAGAIALETIAAENGQAATQVIEVLTSDPLEVTSLSETSAETNGSEIVAYFGLLLLYMAIILYGTWILTGVTEEKSNRVVEVLVSTIRPWQLLAGKIVGIGILAIGQFAVTIAVAYVALSTAGSVDLPEVSASALLNLVVWFILGFLLYATLFGAAGSLVSRVEEAQNAAMPLTLFSVGGFFAGFAVLANPEGAVAVITTLFPLTAPFVVPIRVSLEAIPFWQYGLAILLTVATLYLAIRIAGRIYAGGLLRFGSRTKLREAWRSANE
jgi:ABC-2 type transport system permease protein